MGEIKDQIISSEFVFRGKFLKIIRDQVKTAAGKLWSREYIHHPGASMVIPVLPDGRLVMIRQYRHALKQEFLEFPAGKIDAGESTLVAAKRELEEETGYVASDWKSLTTIHPCIGYANEKIEIFLARDLTLKQAKLDEGEHLTVEAIKFEDLVRWVQEGKVSDVKTQIGVFWYEKIRGKNWIP